MTLNHQMKVISKWHSSLISWTTQVYYIHTVHIYVHMHLYVCHNINARNKHHLHRPNIGSVTKSACKKLSHCMYDQIICTLQYSGNNIVSLKTKDCCYNISVGTSSVSRILTLTDDRSSRNCVNIDNSYLIILKHFEFLEREVYGTDISVSI